MKKLAIVVLALALAFAAAVIETGVVVAGPLPVPAEAFHVVSGSFIPTHSWSISAAGCPSYSQNCIVVPPTGHFSFMCSGQSMSGTASPGSTVSCAQTPAVFKVSCSSQSVNSFSISGMKLHATMGGQLFRFNPSTGHSLRVYAITGSRGVYSVVTGTCSRSVHDPSHGAHRGSNSRIGAGQPAILGIPFVPFGLAVALLLVVAAFAFRSRFKHV